jgi:UDP-N-acetyl-D-glucosamine dehydrogenase
VIVTDHKSVDYQVVVDEAALVVDTRNATAKTRAGRARIISLSNELPGVAAGSKAKAKAHA